MTERENKMIYVMSDIHGNREKLDSLLRQIGLTDSDTLYILGDIVDRGPEPIEILQRVMKMKNVKMLLGNHEHMMLQAYFGMCKPEEHEKCVARWHRNGCEVTMAGLDRLSETQRKEIFDFVTSLPINIETEVNGKKYLFVHGYPAELYKGSEPPYSDEVFFAVWYRMKPEDVMPEGKTVIFGHTSTDNYQDVKPNSIFYGNRMIGIDCGGGYGGDGRIACLRLDDMKEFYA